MAKVEPHRDENSSASPWCSPGLVKSGEIILRTIFDPHHIENGELSQAAIALSDLRERGWSVDRKHYTSLWRLKFDHRRWATKKSDLRRCLVIPISVEAVRSLVPDNKQLLAVTDEALFINPAHAAILLASKSGPAAARKARDLLMTALPPYVDASECFSNVDKGGWRRGILLGFLAPIRYLITIVAGVFRSDAAM